MNSGSAPQTTRSSTTMPTRSKPMVSCRSSAWAIATLVPTPSVEVASTGWRELRERAGVEESGEAADAAHDLGPAGLGDPLLHQLDGAIAGLDVDPAAAYADLSELSGRS